MRIINEHEIRNFKLVLSKSHLAIISVNTGYGDGEYHQVSQSGMMVFGDELLKVGNQYNKH